jgi:glycosyltransferase involved in cell wall biosynthesis
LEQDYQNVEHIVVDGGSTDGTLDILKKYSHLKVICEPDRNLYDALNKGIRASTGEIIGHLNTDDFYHTNIFGEIARYFADDPDLDTVGGGAMMFYDTESGERLIDAAYVMPKDKEPSVYNAILGVPITNARFFHKRVYDSVGLYDIRFPIAADREWMLRAALYEPKFVIMEKMVYFYRIHEGSLSLVLENNMMQRLKEKTAIAELHLDHPNLTGNARRLCKKWHNRESIETVVREMVQLNLSESVRYVKKGCRYDPLWPLRFASHVSLRAVLYPFRRVFSKWKEERFD